jgi:hypothetical protein
VQFAATKKAGGSKKPVVRPPKPVNEDKSAKARKSGGPGKPGEPCCGAPKNTGR